MNYKKSCEVCRILKITPMTLNRWVKSGKIKCEKINSRKFLYDIDSLISNKDENKLNVIYSRVSTTKQKNDLKNQTDIIKKYMLSNGIIPDIVFEEIASGMNDDRKKLNELLDLIIDKKINTVYISYKDRLTRFGFNHYKNLFEKFNTKICIINASQEEDYQQELTQDLISIIHYFSMKIYSKRKFLLKNLKNQLKEDFLQKEI